MLVVYWLIMFTATHWPNHLPILNTGAIDKVAHFAAYFVLAALMAWTAALHGAKLHFRLLLVFWLIAVSYGAVDELLQPPVGRSCELLDWLADAAGAVCGLLACRKYLTERS